MESLRLSFLRFQPVPIFVTCQSAVVAESEVDCEQSLLFSPVIYSTECGNERVHAAYASALGTITGGKRRDCSQSKSEAEYEPGPRGFLSDAKI